MQYLVGQLLLLSCDFLRAGVVVVLRHDISHLIYCFFYDKMHEIPDQWGIPRRNSPLAGKYWIPALQVRVCPGCAQPTDRGDKRCTTIYVPSTSGKSAAPYLTVNEITERCWVGLQSVALYLCMCSTNILQTRLL